MEETPQETIEQGRADALRDIAAGRPKLFWGIRGPCVAFAQDLFRTRYGIKLEQTNCFEWDGMLAYSRGYNHVIAAHLDATHGSDTYRKAEDEVIQFRKAHFEAVWRKAHQERAA